MGIRGPELWLQTHVLHSLIAVTFFSQYDSEKQQI